MWSGHILVWVSIDLSESDLRVIVGGLSLIFFFGASPQCSSCPKLWDLTKEMNECLGASCLPEKELGSFLLLRWKVNFRKTGGFAFLWIKLNSILRVMLKCINKGFFFLNKSLFLELNIDQIWNLEVVAVRLPLLRFDLLSAQNVDLLLLLTVHCPH